jgi:hypothetical protein
LNRHIDSCGWLIRDKQLRFARKGDTDHYSLLHPSTKPEGVVRDSTPGVRNPDELEHFNTFPHRFSLAYAQVQLNGLGDLPSHRYGGIEGRRRFLKYHRDSVAAYVTHDSVGDLQ